MYSLLTDEFAFAYLGLAFFFFLLLGVWIGWIMQAHRAQRAIQEKHNAEMIAVRAGYDARSKDERLTAIERTQLETLRGLRELSKALCINEPPAQRSYFELAD